MLLWRKHIPKTAWKPFSSHKKNYVISVKKERSTVSGNSSLRKNTLWRCTCAQFLFLQKLGDLGLPCCVQPRPCGYVLVICNEKYLLVCYPAFCYTLKLYFIKAESPLSFSHFPSQNLYFTHFHSSSSSTLCPSPLSLPPATLTLFSTCWNPKWLPTRQKEILFLSTDSLLTDGAITLAYNKSLQGALPCCYPRSLCLRGLGRSRGEAPH